MSVGDSTNTSSTGVTEISSSDGDNGNCGVGGGVDWESMSSPNGNLLYLTPSTVGGFWRAHVELGGEASLALSFAREDLSPMRVP